MIAAALFIASSILMLAAMPPKIYGVPLFGLLGFLAAAVLTVVIVVRRE